MGTERRRVDGKKIAKLRGKRKLDQTSLANRLRDRGLGTTQTTVSRWESGQEPRAYVLPALAAELGVAIEDLYAEDDGEAAPMRSAFEAELHTALLTVASLIARNVVAS